MRNGIPICEFFSDPCPYAYGDPHMHTAIPVCELTHTVIQDLISRMRTTSLCIRGLILIPVCIRGLHVMRSPYAYGDFHAFPVCIRGFAHPRMHTGIDLDPRMHTGITCHAIPVCIRGFSCDPRMHTGICLIPVCIRGLLLIPVCIRGLLVM